MAKGQYESMTGEREGLFVAYTEIKRKEENSSKMYLGKESRQVIQVCPRLPGSGIGNHESWKTPQSRANGSSRSPCP